jgi:tetratricopeptide (TPR) repeat protein
MWKGYVLFRGNHAAEARAAFARAIELHPDDAKANYFAGVQLLFRGYSRDALPLLQHAVRCEAANGFQWLALGTAHQSLHQLEAARHCFTQARRLERDAGSDLIGGAASFVADVLRMEGRLDAARAEALAGLEDVERSDHAYRVTFRAQGLVVLGRVALDAADVAGARAAFGQVLAQVKGRPRTRACGHLVVQALAGLARATGDPTYLSEGRQLFEAKRPYNFEPNFGATDAATMFELTLTAEALERGNQLAATVRDEEECGS